MPLYSHKERKNFNPASTVPLEAHQFFMHNHTLTTSTSDVAHLTSSSPHPIQPPSPPLPPLPHLSLNSQLLQRLTLYHKPSRALALSARILQIRDPDPRRRRAKRHDAAEDKQDNPSELGSSSCRPENEIFGRVSRTMTLPTLPHAAEMPWQVAR